LVQATLDEIKRVAGIQPVKIAAQSYLQNFYAQFGFKPVSDVYLEDNIPHLDMVLE
ncbi:GNAT family N-acetyltransferase, partial [Pediococcus acidilactici]|nr:GNAT family N-acetyltransferase [Pediococcus acidilactici]